MRKVTTINLNHNAYQIDEDGYEALRAWLESADRALAANPDRAEILADLEQAIADKCQLALGGYRNVVSAAEIERILQEMGPVADGSAGPAGTATGAAAAGAASGPARPRGLYRVLDGKMLAGVCNGLAAWAGIDPTWVRVAFVLLAVFSGGLWVVAYIAMVLVIPVAATPEQVAAAHGQPFNAQELVDRVKSRHEDRRSERRARRQARRQGMSFTAQPVAPRPAPGYTARVAGGVLLPVFTLLSAAWFAVLAVTLLALWWSWDHVNLAVWPPAGFAGVSHLPQWMAVVLVVAVYMLLALPIAAARRAALYYTNGGQHHGWANAWSGLLWLAVVILALLAAWFALPLFQEVLHGLFGWPRYWATGPTWV
jgi:phage shock protein PspC (stress-responsive transcriptional regulator)